ncbi:MAG: hypothetical protein DRN92_09750 [Thermoproteota archaeon]|nr:MAG: hypothetical protein DRN92_09750 [Candidatus Korarchaeota archaeon]
MVDGDSTIDACLVFRKCRTYDIHEKSLTIPRMQHSKSNTFNYHAPREDAPEPAFKKKIEAPLKPLIWLLELFCENHSIELKHVQ